MEGRVQPEWQGWHAPLLGWYDHHREVYIDALLACAAPAYGQVAISGREQNPPHSPQFPPSSRRMAGPCALPHTHAFRGRRGGICSGRHACTCRGPRSGSASLTGSRRCRRQQHLRRCQRCLHEHGGRGTRASCARRRQTTGAGTARVRHRERKSGVANERKRPTAHGREGASTSRAEFSSVWRCWEVLPFVFAHAAGRRSAVCSRTPAAAEAHG